MIAELADEYERAGWLRRRWLDFWVIVIVMQVYFFIVVADAIRRLRGVRG